MDSYQQSQSEPPTIWRTPDELWQRLAPLLVIDKPRKKAGRPRANDRRLFDALIYLARTGVQWCALPSEFGPKSTAYERFREWVKHGCLQKAWAVLLQEYDQVLGIDWHWQAADGCIVKAPLGKRGPTEKLVPQDETQQTEAKLVANVIS
jgi:putative transposase